MVHTKEERKAYNKEYKQTEKGKMVNIINRWKHRGLIMDNPEDYVTIYYHWLASTHCEKCNIEYTEKNFKCMDHCHITGEYRNILCHDCNVNDNSTNTSGTPNIYWHKKRKRWLYHKIINGKKHQKYFILKEDAIKYKIEYEKQNIYIN